MIDLERYQSVAKDDQIVLHHLLYLESRIMMQKRTKAGLKQVQILKRTQ